MVFVFVGVDICVIFIYSRFIRILVLYYNIRLFLGVNCFFSYDRFIVFEGKDFINFN